MTGIEYRDADRVIVGHTPEARGRIESVFERLGIAPAGQWQSRRGAPSKWWVATEFNTEADYQHVKQTLEEDHK